MELNDITKIIIGHAIEVHKELGPGLLESAYQKCLHHQLIQSGLVVEKEKTLPIVFKDIKIDHGYRMDLVVEKKIVVEIKTVECLNNIHKAQLLTYLRLGKYKVGLLINFNVLFLKNGIKRIIN